MDRMSQWMDRGHMIWPCKELVVCIYAKMMWFLIKDPSIEFLCLWIVFRACTFGRDSCQGGDTISEWFIIATCIRCSLKYKNKEESLGRTFLKKISQTTCCWLRQSGKREGKLLKIDSQLAPQKLTRCLCFVLRQETQWGLGTVCEANVLFCSN